MGVDGVTKPIIQHIFVEGQDLKENKNILNNHSSEFFFKSCTLNLLGYSVGGTNYPLPALLGVNEKEIKIFFHTCSPDELGR